MTLVVMHRQAPSLHVDACLRVRVQVRRGGSEAQPQLGCNVDCEAKKLELPSLKLPVLTWQFEEEPCCQCPVSPGPNSTNRRTVPSDGHCCAARQLSLATLPWPSLSNRCTATGSRVTFLSSSSGLHTPLIRVS